MTIEPTTVGVDQSVPYIPLEGCGHSGVHGIAEHAVDRVHALFIMRDEVIESFCSLQRDDVRMGTIDWHLNDRLV